jgi:hypothetical protein
VRVLCSRGTLLICGTLAAGDPDPTFFPTPSSRSGAGLGAQLPLGLASSDGTNVFARAFPPATSSLSRSRFAGDGAVPAPALTPTLLDPVAIRQQSVGVEAVEARKTWSKSQWENARAASALDDRLTIERGFAQMHVSDRATWPPISSAEGRPTSDFHERLNHIALRYPGYQTLPPHAMPRVRLAREALLQPHEDLYYQSAYPVSHHFLTDGQPITNLSVQPLPRSRSILPICSWRELLRGVHGRREAMPRPIVDHALHQRVRRLADRATSRDRRDTLRD